MIKVTLVTRLVPSEPSGRARIASKKVELEFAPVAGMRYHDSTWKNTDGREIQSVLVSNDDRTISVVVTLPDDAIEKIEGYQGHGWSINP